MAKFVYEVKFRESDDKRHFAAETMSEAVREAERYARDGWNEYEMPEVETITKMFSLDNLGD